VAVTATVAAATLVAQPTAVGGTRGCVTDTELRRVVVAETSMQEFATITGATPRNQPRTVLRFRGKDGDGPMWSSIDLRYRRCSGQPTLLVTYYATTTGRLVYARSAKKWWPW
jgi:hypothetical protein